MSYASVYEQTRVVTYLFHDCERSLWLFCSVWHLRAMIKVQYTSTSARRLPVLRVCAMIGGLTEFCVVFRFGFRASFLDFTSRIERLHVCYYCADVWSVLAYFVVIQSCTSIDRHVRSGHRQRVYVAVFVTRVADQLFALNRGCCRAC